MLALFLDRFPVDFWEVWFEIVCTTNLGQFLSLVVEETPVFAPRVLTSDGLKDRVSVQGEGRGLG